MNASIKIQAIDGNEDNGWTGILKIRNDAGVIIYRKGVSGATPCDVREKAEKILEGRIKK